MAEIGRPTECTPENQERFIRAIKLGCDYTDCCNLIGISTETWRKWRVRANEGTEPYRGFVAAVNVAEAEGSEARMACIHAHAGEDWRAAAWVQERRFPERYGKQRVEVTGIDGGAIKIMDASQAAMEIEAANRALERARNRAAAIDVVAEPESKPEGGSGSV